MPPHEQLSAVEQRAYDSIVDEDGIYQSELWKILDITSRKGSGVAMALSDAGLINRKPTTTDGRRTYWLTPTDSQQSPDTDKSREQPTGGLKQRTESREHVLDPRDRKALELVRNGGGIYQSELWKELDVSSRTGSRIASRLKSQGLIRREEAVYNGQRTYRLRPAIQDLDFSLLMAGDRIAPFVSADEQLDPIESAEFTHWLFQLAQDERYSTYKDKPE